MRFYSKWQHKSNKSADAVTAVALSSSPLSLVLWFQRPDEAERDLERCTSMITLRYNARVLKYKL